MLVDRKRKATVCNSTFITHSFPLLRSSLYYVGNKGYIIPKTYVYLYDLNEGKCPDIESKMTYVYYEKSICRSIWRRLYGQGINHRISRTFQDLTCLPKNFIQ